MSKRKAEEPINDQIPVDGDDSGDEDQVLFHVVSVPVMTSGLIQIFGDP